MKIFCRLCCLISTHKLRTEGYKVVNFLDKHDVQFLFCKKLSTITTCYRFAASWQNVFPFHSFCCSKTNGSPQLFHFISFRFQNIFNFIFNFIKSQFINNMQREDLFLLLSSMLLTTVCSINYSLIYPFFADYSESRGVSIKEYSLVIGFGDGAYVLGIFMFPIVRFLKAFDLLSLSILSLGLTYFFWIF